MIVSRLLNSLARVYHSYSYYPMTSIQVTFLHHYKKKKEEAFMSWYQRPSMPWFNYLITTGITYFTEVYFIAKDNHIGNGVAALAIGLLAMYSYDLGFRHGFQRVEKPAGEANTSK